MIKIRKAKYSDLEILLEMGYMLSKELELSSKSIQCRPSSLQRALMNEIANLDLGSKLLLWIVIENAKHDKNNIERLLVYWRSRLKIESDVNAVRDLRRKNFITTSNDEYKILFDSKNQLAVKTFLEKELFVKRQSRISILKDRIGGENVVYFADQNHEIIGFIQGYIIDTGIDKFAQVERVYIKHKKRRQGIGKLLLRKFVAHCKQNGVLALYVVTPARDKEAIFFYLKEGFKKSPYLFMSRNIYS